MNDEELTIQLWRNAGDEQYVQTTRVSRALFDEKPDMVITELQWLLKKGDEELNDRVFTLKAPPAFFAFGERIV